MSEGLIKVKDAAKMLGLSVPSVFRLCNQGRIPHVDLGAPGGRRCLRFEPEAIKALIKARTRGGTDKAGGDAGAS